VGSTHHLEVVFVWKQNYILVDEYFFFCCTWIVNSADIKVRTIIKTKQGKNPRLRNDFLRCAIGVNEQRGWR
ncbi:hypothetical protein NOI83_21370, partial [Escherichia coli]|uniref:hypothetical protein n=1 Tax=Escherichia coli TaxID=562 RepID=UPI002874C9A1